MEHGYLRTMFSDWSHVWLQNKLSFILFEVRVEYLCQKQNKTLRISKLIQQRGRTLGQQKKLIVFRYPSEQSEKEIKKTILLKRITRTQCLGINLTRLLK